MKPTWAALFITLATVGIIAQAQAPSVPARASAQAGRLTDADAPRPKAYLAGPLGFSEAGRAFHNGTMLKLVKETGFEPLDPWTLTPQSLIDSARNLARCDLRAARWREVNAIIGQNNAKAIRACRVVVAVLDGSDVDSGTAAEIGYAAALGKVILGYRGDFRLSSDNEGSVINVQVEYFIRQSGGEIVRSIPELRRALIKHRP